MPREVELRDFNRQLVATLPLPLATTHGPEEYAPTVIVYGSRCFVQTEATVRVWHERHWAMVPAPAPGGK